jgi:hypothetical protein
MGEHTPKVQRYNDDKLKTRFLRNKSIDEVMAEDFAPLSGKKVFYIDEAFSSGKGAVALDKATSQAGIDMRYFALTRATQNQKDLSAQAPFEPGKFYGLSLEGYKKELERIQNDPRFTIYPNDIPILFTKDAAVLSVVDPEGETKSRYELVSGDEADGLYDYKPKRGELPHARHFDKPPTGMSWEEFDKRVREMNMRTVRTLTHMIYEALTKSDEGEAAKLESVLGSIMTAEQYAEIRHETPYIFELKAGDKELYYFGTPHVSDPQDPLFAEIEGGFQSIERRCGVLFIEDVSVRGDKTRFNERVKAASRDEAIDQMGESGFTLKLAVEKGIDWYCPEPSDKDLYKNLLAKGFSKDEIFAWDVFHILPQYNRQMNWQGFKQYVERFIERFKETTNWENFDYSYEHAIKLGEQILGRPLDVENEPDATDFIDPIPREEKKETQTILNRIGSAASLFRDRKIVSDILEAFKNHNRVFVVYDASHAAMQEPALKKAFESA